MKQKLLFLMLFLSISNIYSECVNSKMTRPIVVDTFCTLTTCCADLKNTITNFSVTIATTLTATGPCDFTPITSAQVISSPGTFCLANDIIGTITIDADNVVLDLNGKEISGAQHGIVITSTHRCIVVENGFIKNCAQEGVLADSGSEIILLDLVVVNCSSNSNPFGIRFINSRDCKVQECLVTDGFAGIALDTTNNSLVQDCQVLTCTQATVSVDGFFSNGNSNQFDNCAVVDFLTTIGAVQGFNITSIGDNTILTNCSARTFGAPSSNVGFNIQGDCCVLDECIASDFSLIVPATGVVLFNILGARNCIRNSVAQCGHGDRDAIGFNISGSDNIIEKCKAHNLTTNQPIGFANGYQFSGTRHIAKECIAANIMGSAPAIGNGFAATGAITNLLITECEASSCSFIGFSVAGATNSAINCVAISNASNYAVAAPSGTPTIPGAVLTTGANIDI